MSIKGFDSDLLEVKCGVPQGSTLRPLLFLLYIIDLRFSLQNSNVSHFADDTCLTYPSKDVKSLELSLNTDIVNVIDWLNTNRSSLNVKKLNCLFSIPKENKLILLNC